MKACQRQHATGPAPGDLSASLIPSQMANSTDLKRVLTALFGFLFFCVGAFAPPRVAADRCVTPPAGLISWWRAESNAADVLNVNNGTLEGGVTFAAGEVGQAFSFNGASDVQVPDSPSLDFASNSPMTIELWAYRTGAETSMYLIGKRDADCGSVQYQIGFDPYNGMAFDAGDGSVATGIQMPMTTWIHLAATFDGANTFEFYTNGTLAATGNGNLGPTNSGPLRIGNSSVCGGFTGLIDEVSLYNDAPLNDDPEHLCRRNIWQMPLTTHHRHPTAKSNGIGGRDGYF